MMGSKEYMYGYRTLSNIFSGQSAVTNGPKACQKLSFHLSYFAWYGFQSVRLQELLKKTLMLLLPSCETILISAFQQSKLNEQRCFWEDCCLSNVQNISSQLQTVLIMTNNIYCFEEERENICGHSWVASWMDRPV